MFKSDKLEHFTNRPNISYLTSKNYEINHCPIKETAKIAGVFQFSLKIGVTL